MIIGHAPAHCRQFFSFGPLRPDASEVKLQERCWPGIALSIVCLRCDL